MWSFMLESPTKIITGSYHSKLGNVSTLNSPSFTLLIPLQAKKNYQFVALVVLSSGNFRPGPNMCKEILESCLFIWLLSLHIKPPNSGGEFEPKSPGLPHSSSTSSFASYASMFGPTPPGPPQNPASQPLPMTGTLNRMHLIFISLQYNNLHNFFLQIEKYISNIKHRWFLQMHLYALSIYKKINMKMVIMKKKKG